MSQAEESVRLERFINLKQGSLSVKEYITDAEDYMMYHRGYYDAREKMMKLLVKETENPT